MFLGAVVHSHDQSQKVEIDSVGVVINVVIYRLLVLLGLPKVSSDVHEVRESSLQGCRLGCNRTNG